MFDLTDTSGYLKNSGSAELIQKEYKPLLDELTSACQKYFKQELLAVYVRGSVSIGQAKPGLSDIDMVAVTNRTFTDTELSWINPAMEKLEKEDLLIELTVLSLDELINSPNFFQLRLNLKTRSVCLYGQDVLPQVPEIKIDNELAKELYLRGLEGLRSLAVYFKNPSKKSYLNRPRPVSFWCIWAMRTILRSSMSFVMTQEPLYTPDLPTCFSALSKFFPDLETHYQQALDWAKKPSSDHNEINKFINNFLPLYEKLGHELIINA